MGAKVPEGLPTKRKTISLFTILLTSTIYMEGVSVSTNSPTLQTASGYRTIQFDTTYPHLVQTPQVKRSAPQDCPRPLPLASCKSQAVAYHLYF